MLTGEDILRELKNEQPHLRETFHVSRLGLFGSFARNAASDESDIDLLVEFDGEVDLYETKQQLRDYLGQRFRRRIDLCRERYLKPFAREEILREVIYV